jgi:hypothetical protein
VSSSFVNLKNLFLKICNQKQLKNDCDWKSSQTGQKFLRPVLPDVKVVSFPFKKKSKSISMVE